MIPENYIQVIKNKKTTLVPIKSFLQKYSNHDVFDPKHEKTIKFSDNISIGSEDHLKLTVGEEYLLFNDWQDILLAGSQAKAVTL